MMSLRQWIGRKIAGTAKNNGTLSDIDRDNALAVRRTKAALTMQENQIKLLERITQIDGSVEPKQSVMDQMLSQAIPVLLAKMANEGKTPGSTPNPSLSQEVVYSDEQISKMLTDNPKLKKHASKFSDEGIREYMIQQIPNLSKDSIQRIILKVRS